MKANGSGRGQFGNTLMSNSSMFKGSGGAAGNTDLDLHSTQMGMPKSTNHTCVGEHCHHSLTLSGRQTGWTPTCDQIEI